MFDIQASTMLAYVAGAAVFVCLAMIVYMSVQRVPPGFGLWAVSSGLIGFSCWGLADQEHLPQPVVILVIPGLILVAAILRMQAVRQFFGRKSMDLWLLLLPLVPVAIISLFTYVWENAGARIMVTAVGIAAAAWAMAAVSMRGRIRPLPWFHRLVAALFVGYGGLWLGSGIHWLVKGWGFPLQDVDTHAIIFFTIITAYELFWLVTLLVISAKRRADELEAAQRELLMAQRQLEDVVAFLPDATFALDKEQKVIAWNRAIAAKTGVPVSEVLGMHWHSGAAQKLVGGGATLSEALLDPTKAIPSRCKDVRRDGDSMSAGQEWHHPSDPSRRGHFWHMATLLRDAEGQVTGTIESIRDVTAEVEAENAIRESEDRYRSLFEHSLDGVLVIAPGGAVVDANPSACRMLGMAKDEICEADPGSLVFSGDQTQGSTEQLGALGTGLRELDFVRGDGSTFPAECMSVVWTDSQGRLRSFVQFRDIGERVESQRILRDSRASLLESQLMPQMGSWEIDISAHSIRLSPGAKKILGIEHESSYFPLKSGMLTGVAKDPEALRNALDELMSEGGSRELDYVLRGDSDGREHKVRSIVSAICDSKGSPVRLVGVVQDATETSSPPGLWRPSSDELERSDDQVFWVNEIGNITNVNDTACEQLGYSREELTSMTIYDLNPALLKGTADRVEGVKAAGGRRHETIHRAKDGRDIPVEVAINIASFEGEDYKFVVAHDISDRKALEEALRRTEISLKHGGGAVLWVDAEGRLTYATDEACGRLRLDREDLLAKNVGEVGIVLKEGWARIWAEIMKHGSYASLGTVRDSEGSEEQVDVVCHRAKYEGRDYALVVIRDLSAHLAGVAYTSEDELATLQSEKLEAVGQLAGGIAHDFNNLLTAIMGYGDMILAGEEGRSPAALRKDASEIRNAAERAAALTSQILAFARRQPLRPTRVDLMGFVQGLEAQIRTTLAEGVELTVGVTGESCTVEVDVEHLRRVVMSLVTNAKEAMPEGGHLHVGVDTVELSDESCRTYPEMHAGSYAVLSVSDTGIGMDDQTKQRIFEPFFTTKAPGEGTGLGLSAVYGFVRQSGGNVVAYSEVGRGTTMKVYLPRLATPVPSWEPVSQEGGESVLCSETILVVDDEAPLRRLVARVLGDSGYRIFVAGSGVEAMELLEDMGDPPDLLVTDVVLPGEVQGNDLAEWFSTKVPHLPVLYMSGHPRDAIVHSGRLDEGVIFLSKPFTPEKLSAMVRGVLDSARQLR